MQGNDAMEEIMAQIKEHLLPVKEMGANGNVHHYNRVWDKISRWHRKYGGDMEPRAGRKEEEHDE
jgi:hypothetical protein